MVGQFVVQRADQGEAVRLAGDPREEFADMHARRAGADRPERAANALGCVGFGIERLEMARPAPHPEEDDRRVRRTRRGGAAREQLGQTQPAQRERAGPEDEVIKCLMPLTTSYEILDEGLDILENAIAEEFAHTGTGRICKAITCPAAVAADESFQDEMLMQAV